VSENKSIILYDFLLVRGGAESLTLTLCDAVPQLDLAVAFIDQNNFEQAPLADGRITTLCRPTHLVGWQSLKVAHAFERKNQWLSHYDKVIFSGSNAPLAVKYRKNQGNLLYCHTPPRFIYDLKEHYLTTIAAWQRPLLRVLIGYMQPKYEAAIDKMNLIIANSINVQQRIRRYLGKESIVIYPPCHVDKYQWLSQGDYYLSTARVEPYKRIQLLVEAFKRMPDKKLVVASGGSQLESLQQLAKGYDNIRFTGWCEQQQLQQLMGNCIATLYLPMDEDFGISPVESMAAGKPVIGVAEGGVKETVHPGVSGLLCPADPNVHDVIEAVAQMSAAKALLLRTSCEQHAQLFAVDIFTSKMKKLIECDDSELSQVAALVDASKAQI
jgi:glycosyltransferase involved in cell wall biosynthesis